MTKRATLTPLLNIFEAYNNDVCSRRDSNPRPVVADRVEILPLGGQSLQEPVGTGSDMFELFASLAWPRRWGMASVFTSHASDA